MVGLNSTPLCVIDNYAQYSTVLTQTFLEFSGEWTETIIDNILLTISFEEDFVNDKNLESFIQLLTNMEESMLASLASHEKD